MIKKEICKSSHTLYVADFDDGVFSVGGAAD